MNDADENRALPSQEANLITQKNQKNYLSSPDERNKKMKIGDNLASLVDQAHTLPVLNSQLSDPPKHQQI